jgi:hypothetical protein
MIPPLFGKQEVGIWWVQKRFPRYGVLIWSLWPASYRYPILWEVFLDPSDSYFLFTDLFGFYTHWTYTCTFFVTFFSATIDGRDLIFGHTLHIGTRKMRRKMCIKINKICKQEVGICWVQKRFPRYGVPIWSLWLNIRSRHQ